MAPDRFTPYSCSVSGNVPRELWMDYDEEDEIGPEDDGSSSKSKPEDTDASTDPSAARREQGVLAHLITVLTDHHRTMGPACP